MGNTTDTLEQVEQLAARLVSRIDALEHRVEALEHPQATPAAAAPRAPLSQPAPLAPAEGGLASAFPVLGAALLGIAGAYVLRAISGAGLLPRSVVAAAAALYAAAWLFAAGRLKPAARSPRFVAAVRALTALLILSPMLWEMSIRFRDLHPFGAVAVLAGFAALAAFIGRKSDPCDAFVVAFAGLSLTALALSVATHHMPEFTALILALYAAAEFTALPRTPALRALLALTADAAAWTLLLIYRLPAAERVDYPAWPAWLVLSLSAALLALEIAALLRATLVQRRRIAMAQAAQSTVAFAILLCGMQWLMPGGGLPAIGLLCLVLAAACSAAAYGPFRTQPDRRNFRVFAGWALSLLLAALFLLAPVPQACVAAAVLGTLALALADRLPMPVLAWQGAVLLALGAAGSGLAVYCVAALAGTVPPPPAWPVIAAAACALAAYALAAESPAESAYSQAVHLLAAILAACTVIALAIHALVAAIRLVLALDVFHIALLRTVVVCCVAVVLAYCGAALRRRALSRVAYGALGFATAKLLFEDLPHGHLAFIAGSIFIVALTFIAVPRLARTSPPR